MTPDRRLAYLSDIVSAVELIQSFASGKTAEALKEDILLRSGVERQFTIVGEAVSKLLRLDPSLESAIPAARKIVGFRNQLVHNYGSIDPYLVWTVIQQDLGPLQKTASGLLKEFAK